MRFDSLGCLARCDWVKVLVWDGHCPYFKVEVRLSELKWGESVLGRQCVDTSPSLSLYIGLKRAADQGGVPSPSPHRVIERNRK